MVREKWLSALSIKYQVTNRNTYASGYSYILIGSTANYINTFKDEAQTALFKDPVRTAL
jgi:hypothetical protein